jgi:type I restriction enzyme S subunit
MAVQVPVPELTVQSSFDDLQSKVTALKVKPAAVRAANQTLVAATLERVFTETE